MDTALDAFARTAADTAMRAAAAWVLAHPASQVAVDALVAALRRRLRDALRAGLADAREAFAAGMPQAAEATFLATIRLAGIAAAEECAGVGNPHTGNR